MITPFKIKFKRTISNEPNKDILARFKKSFADSYCDHIHIFDDNKLIVENDFLFRWKPDLNWNLWVGVGKAEISINDNVDKKTKDVEYLIDFTRDSVGAIIRVIIVAFILSFDFFSEISNNAPIVILVIVIALGLISHLITFLRHRSIFLRTVFGPLQRKEYYNWTKILQNKTGEELLDIYQGKTHLPKEVSELAKIELDKRSDI